jgi:hypothetical protein
MLLATVGLILLTAIIVPLFKKLPFRLHARSAWLGDTYLHTHTHTIASEGEER